MEWDYYNKIQENLEAFDQRRTSEHDLVAC